MIFLQKNIKRGDKVDNLCNGRFTENFSVTSSVPLNFSGPQIDLRGFITILQHHMKWQAIKEIKLLVFEFESETLT